MLSLFSELLPERIALNDGLLDGAGSIAILARPVQGEPD
jgi:hypothetical protein